MPLLKCERDSSPLEPYKKIFHSEDLSKLSLEYLDNYMINDSIICISDYVTANFDLHPNHLASLRYCGKSGNVLAVSFFETQETAIEIAKRVDALSEAIK